MRPFFALVILATISGTLAAADPPRLDREGDPLPTGAVARFGHNRLRHPGISGEDDGFAFNPAGKTIASWDENSVRLWDLAGGRRLWHLESEANIFDVVIAPDGKRLAVCTAKEVVVVDAATGKPERTLNASARGAAAFSPDSGVLATAKNDWGQWIDLWDVTTGEKITEFPVEKHGKPQALGFSADGKTLSAAVWGTREGSAIVWVVSWDLKTRERRPDFDPHVRMSSYRISPDGRLLGTRTAANSLITLWDVPTGKSIGTIDLGIGHFNYAGDGKSIVTSVPDRKERTTHIAVWDAATCKKVREIKISFEFGEQARLSPDGKLFATAKRGEMLCLWDATTSERRMAGVGHTGQVIVVAFALGGDMLITADGSELRIWDAETGARRGSLPIGTRGFSLLRGGEAIVTQEGFRRIDLTTGKPVGEPFAPPGLTGMLAGDVFYLWHAIGSAAGRTIVGRGLVRGPGRKVPVTYLVIWDVQTGKVTTEHAVAEPLPEALSPDGRISSSAVTTGRPNPDEQARKYYPTELLTDVKCFDAATGRTLSAFRLPQEYRYHSVLSADGQTLAVVTSKHGAVPAHPAAELNIRLYEVRTGKERRVISLQRPGYYDPARLMFSPGGRLLAVSREACRIEVFDTATGREVASFGGFESISYSLALRADGRRLASGHADGTVLAWDVPAPPKPPAMESAWADLASEDAGKAFAASWAFAANPAATVKLLGKCLEPADPAVIERVKVRVADLDSKSFKVREVAARELGGLVEIADPFLQTALRGKLSDEQQARLKTILEPPAVVRSPELLRTLRGIETLERIGTLEAAEVLRKLAGGPAELRPTVEARAALERMRLPNPKSK
jgi:WD40 repeat protein